MCAKEGVTTKKRDLVPTNSRIEVKPPLNISVDRVSPRGGGGCDPLTPLPAPILWETLYRGTVRTRNLQVLHSGTVHTWSIGSSCKKSEAWWGWRQCLNASPLLRFWRKKIHHNSLSKLKEIKWTSLNVSKPILLWSKRLLVQLICYEEILAVEVLINNTSPSKEEKSDVCDVMFNIAV